MVYDPSAKSRSASGVFPRGFPFTSTSASAGVDRMSTLPVCAPRTAPDAGRDGEGLGALRAMGAFGAMGTGLPAGLSAVALCGGCAEVEVLGDAGAEAGRSTMVASTPGSWPGAGVGRGDRRKNPTDNAVRTAKTRKAATIGQRRLVGSNSISVCNSRGCGAHDFEKSAGDDGVMIGSIGSSGNAMRSTASSTRRSKSVSGAMGAMGETGAGFAPVAPTAPIAPIAPAIAAANSPARAGRIAGSTASAASNAARRALPCSASRPFRLSAEARLPVAASKAIAPNEYTSDASSGDEYRGRVGSFAPMVDNAAAMPKPVMRAASAATTMSRKCSKP